MEDNRFAFVCLIILIGAQYIVGYVDRVATKKRLADVSARVQVLEQQNVVDRLFGVQDEDSK